MKRFVRSHFENIYLELERFRPVLDGASFSSLSYVDKEYMIAPFSMEEIKKAVWSCDGNKSLGPDGFNFSFFKSCWEVVEGDIVRFMNDFHTNGVLPKVIISSFIALVPKNEIPQSLTEYRPISWKSKQDSLKGTSWKIENGS